MPACYGRRVIDLPALLFVVDRALAEMLAGRWTPETAARLVSALHELETEKVLPADPQRVRATPLGA